MNEWWATLYGFIQGLTEFLPVSSSGHLAIVPFFFELQDPGVVFDLMMHLGTAFAVIMYFWKDVKVLLFEALLFLKRDFKGSGYFQNFAFATTGSFVLILMIKGLAFEYGRSPLVIAGNLMFFGILMFISDTKEDRGVDLTQKRDLKTSLIIGLSQSIAVFPGVSRSGITLTSSRFLGMGRVAASRFSFLLSLPVILGSAIFKLPEVLSGEATYVSASVILIGIISSFVFGLLTIHFFLKLISKIGLKSFTIYRLILGLILLYFIFTR